MWETINEKVVNNIPPTCILSNIDSVLEAVSHQTIINNVPSISTICRGRTVLHVALCALVAYTLGGKECK